jgi:thioesterase domain-containing protein
VKITPLPLGVAIAHNGKLPFYLVHSITGAGVREFRHLAELIGPYIQIYALNVPLTERSAAAARSMALMAADYREQVRAHFAAHYDKRTPLLLGGWSAGAILALEIAQQLRHERSMPTLLVAIDKCPRHTKAEIGPWNGTGRNVWLWLKRSWRNSDTAPQAIASIAAKLGAALRTGKLYGGPDAEYDSAAVIRALSYQAKSDGERDFIESFYAQTTGYVPETYFGRVLVIVSDDGWRDRVVEGWREIADDRKIVRLTGTSHRSLVFGNLHPGNGLAAGAADLSDVRQLAEVLIRELRFFDPHKAYGIHQSAPQHPSAG